MKIKRPTTEDLTSMKSKYSSMRWAFVTMVKLSVVIAISATLGAIIGSFFSIAVPLSGITAILGVILTTAFGGKAAQSFSRYDTVEETENTENTESDPNEGVDK